MATLMFAAMLAAAQASAAQVPDGLSTTGQPTAFDLAGKPYAVLGYGAARWGMTPAEVRGAIPKDFPGARIGPDVIDPVNRTTIVVAAIDKLAPGSGPAVVTYVFGATSGRLFHVNVDWRLREPSPGDRTALTEAGSHVVAGFISYDWKLLSVARGVPTGPNALLLFAGSDEAGGAVDVTLQGVAYTVHTRTGEAASPPPTGPALLHVGLAQTNGQPDVAAIRPGAF